MLRQALYSSSRAVARTAQPTRTQFRAVPAILLPSQRAQIGRWYSAETDATKSEPAGEKAEGVDAAKVSDGEAALRKELETKSKEALDFKDKYLRSVADFRNLQDRTTREVKAARDFGIQKFAKDLVDTVDNLDRALSMVPADKLAQATSSETAADSPLKDLANLHEGLRMTETIMMQTLKKHGLERFDPDGEKFNPNEHEATFMTPQPDKENNTVFFVQQKGFRLNGRILRAAKVGVVKNN